MLVLRMLGCAQPLVGVAGCTFRTELALTCQKYSECGRLALQALHVRMQHAVQDRLLS